MKLFLTRHGETFWNTKHLMQGTTDTKLNEKGIKEGEKLAKRLRRQHFDYIYSSPLSRAKETAEAVRKYHSDTPFEVTDALIERNFGEFEGHTKKEIGWNTSPHPEPRNGESSFDTVGRMSKFVTKLLKKHGKNATILVVAHKHINTAIIGAVLNADWNSVYDMSKWGNTSVTILDIEKLGQGEIVLLDDTSHL
ncbi:MAG: histidine phosphatase family protein [Candidatus Gracilibacteria bacterium]